ncbi:MAG: hypothetical protein ACM3JC_15420, partial [Rudaea sp.]
MTLDLGGTVLGHGADDQSAQRRNDQDPRAQRICLQTGNCEAKTLEEHQVGDDGDQGIQGIGHKARQEPNQSREQGDQQHSKAAGLGQVEIPVVATVSFRQFAPLGNL